MDEKEVWKKIKGFKKYKVSTFGRIKNINTNYIFHTNNDPKKYVRLTLTDDDSKVFRKYVHVLVANAFIPNEDETKTTINHIDKNKSNNRVDNLEWMSRSEQVLHSNKVDKDNKKVKKINNSKRAVEQYNMDGEFLNKFDSVKEASAELEIPSTSIVAVCKGRAKTTRGFVFKYVEPEIFEDEVWEKYNKNYDIEVSNYGRIKFNNGRISYGSTNHDGYKKVYIKNFKTNESVSKLVHVLVGEIFLENENELPTINHKDGDKSNNHVDNLEWMSHASQSKHAFETGLKKYKTYREKKVAQYDLDGNLIKIYKSIAEASRQTGCKDRSIAGICYGKKYFKTAKNFRWKFVK